VCSSDLAGLPPTRFVLRDGIEFAVTPDSQEPFGAFTWSQPDMVDEMDAFLAATRSRLRLLDIGALHGVFSLAFTSRRPEAEAVAVDPSPLAFPRLLYNVHANPGSRIRTVEAALSDRGGQLPMRFEWQHAVAGDLSEEESSISVRALTGDELCAEFGFEPDTVKVDVEGHEVQVLEGLRGVIARARPLIFLEVHPWRIRFNGRSTGELDGLLDELDYEWRDTNNAPTEDLDVEGERRLILSPRDS